MATQNGVIETSTGDLLRTSFGPMVAGAGETLRGDAPVPAKVRGDRDEVNMHRWVDPDWTEVAQAAAIISPSRLPVGTTAERDETAPFTGALWCNTTTGQVEFYNGSSWAVVGGGGGGTLQFVETLTALDVATLDFEGLTAGNHYILHFENILPVVNNDELQLRFGTGAGPTYETTLYGYNIHGMLSSGHILTYNSDSAEAFIQISSNVDESNGRGVIGSLDAFLPSGKNAQVRGSLGHIEHGGQVYMTDVYGKRGSNDDVTALRIFFAGGNIDTGKIHLYKMLRS